MLSNACYFDLRQIILISVLINRDVYIISACKVLRLHNVIGKKKLYTGVSVVERRRRMEIEYRVSVQEILMKLSSLKVLKVLGGKLECLGEKHLPPPGLPPPLD